MAALMISGSMWEDSGVTLLARVYGNSGSLITQATTSSITYKIFDLGSSTPTTAIATGSLTVASVVFDTLQTDAIWTADSTGYCFKAAFAASNFATGDRTYRIEIKFTPSTGEVFYQPFTVDVGEIYSG